MQLKQVILNKNNQNLNNIVTVLGKKLFFL
jgi:hypothetical protein